jgi:hypothetical protein
MCATSCPVFGRSGPCSFAPGTRFVKCGLLGALPRGWPRVLGIASTRPRIRPGSLLSGFSTDCSWRIKLHLFLPLSSYMFNMFRVYTSFRFRRSESGLATEKRVTLLFLVSFCLESRCAPVSSSTVATAESVRMTNFHIHLVRGDRKSFICIGSSALPRRTVFPTVPLSFCEQGFQLLLDFCLGCFFCVRHSCPSVVLLTMLRFRASLRGFGSSLRLSPLLFLTLPPRFNFILELVG